MLITLALFSVVAFPVFFTSFRLWKQTHQVDPHKVDLVYFAVMALVLVLLPIFKLLDFILIGGITPTVAYLVLMLLIPVLAYAAYRGYFARKSGK